MDLSAFTPDQLKLIGSLVVMGGFAFVGFVWRVAVWVTETRLKLKALTDDVDTAKYDIDNLGEKLETDKAMDLARTEEGRRRAEIRRRRREERRQE